MRIQIGAVLLFAGALAGGSMLGGCSGDSGDSSPAPAAAITAESAPQAAGQSMDSVNHTLGMQELVEAVIYAVDPASTDNPQVVECPDGGEMSIQWKQASATALSVGDTFQATFTDCAIPLEDTTPETINGDAAVQINSVAGVEGEIGYTLGLAATFTDLEVEDAEEDLTINGGFTIQEAIQGPADDITTSTIVAGKSMTIAATDGSESVGLSNFQVQELESTNTNQETVWITGTATSQTLGGYMLLSTVIPFVSDADQNPYEGALKIVGAVGNSVLLESESADNVQLWLDLNGDGRIEMASGIPIELTWDELEAAAGF